MEVRRRTARTGAAAILGFTIAAGLLGFGGRAVSEQSKPANAILADAKTAVSHAKSFRVSGQMLSGGQHIRINLVFTPKRVGGTLSEGKATFQLVVAGGKLYLKADAATYQQITHNAAAGQLLGGRWIMTTTSDPNFSGLAGLADVSSLLKPSGKVTKAGVTRIGGRPAVALVDTTGGKLYVATTGPAYVLEMAKNTRSDAGKILFTGYGTQRPPAIPTGALDLSKLSSAG